MVLGTMTLDWARKMRVLTQNEWGAPFFRRRGEGQEPSQRLMADVMSHKGSQSQPSARKNYLKQCKYWVKLVKKVANKVT